MMAITFNQIGSKSDLQNAKRYVNAYLRLFNEPGNLKFLSFTGIPFKRETVEVWLRDADASETEYHTAIGKNGKICAFLPINDPCMCVGSLFEHSGRYS